MTISDEERATSVPNFDLQDRVAVVTGSTRGIGRGLAIALSQLGTRLVVTGRDAGQVAALANELDADSEVFDVASVADVRRGIDAIAQRHGRIDILVNNAGLGDNHAALNVTEADWDGMFAVNLKGLFFCCQSAGRHMIQKGFGRIINISSQASLVGIRDHAVYCATKGGVNSLTQVLALEWAPHGITVNAIAPTFIRTPGTAERLDDPDTRRGIVARIPIGEVGNVADVAGAVAYLASKAARLVTGTVLTVDGGWTAQ